MGTTLASAGPLVGGAAQGFVQGRQAGTEEATRRQQLALNAAQEGRTKEQHRLNIQQLQLAIQGMQQQQEQAAQLFPGQLEGQQFGLRGHPGAEATVPYRTALGFPEFQGTAGEVENLATNRFRARSQDISAARGSAEDDMFERELIRGQMRFIQEDLKQARMEQSSAKLAINKLRIEDPEHPDLPEMEAELSLINADVRELERQYREFISSLGAGEKGSGRVTPVPGKRPLAPPPVSK